MATAHIVANGYTRSNTNYTNVADETNMYNPVTNTSGYASLRGRNRNSSTAYYIFINNFKFDDLPTGATVTAFSVKIKCYRSSNQRTGSNFYLRLSYASTSGSVISGTTTSTDIGTTASTITIPTGNLTWDDIVEYGSTFSIEVPLASNSSSYPYVYVYGAEIEVTYSMPTPYDITVTNNTSGTVTPTGTTTVYAGYSFTTTINGVSSPTVTDNNVDVTNQLVKITGGTTTYIPYDYTNSGFTISNISNAYSDISGSTYADCSLSGRTTGNLYLDLGPINLPSGATITSVSCQASLQVSRNGSSSSMTASCQMYSGTTAKGSSYSIVSSATDVARTTYTLTVGNWTTSELQNARFYLTMYNGASSTVRHIYVYGVSFTVTYTVSGDIYTYTITNIAANHTIVVSASSGGPKFYIKNNGTWTQVSKIYKKVSGSWVEQASSTWSTLFNTSTNYVKGGN